MKNVNRHISNVDYWQADILSAYDYSPFGVMLSGRTFEKEETVEVCHNETTLTTTPVLEEGFGSWFTWTTMGSALLTYVNGEMQVSNPSNSSNNIGASKTFTTGSGVHSVSFDIIDNTCATVVLWPPSVTPKTINVYIRDNANNIIASGAYTTAGTYNLSFTPTNSGLTYKMEFYMTSASAFCYYRIDDVLITYQSEQITQVCENVSRSGSYRYGFNNFEKDDQVSGKGNSYTAEFWQYSPRLGRRWNIDPVFKEYESPYATFGNNPIYFTDPDGADIKPMGEEAKQILKDFIYEVFGDKSGFKVKNNRVKFNEKQFLKKNYEGVQLELANRFKEVVTNHKHITGFFYNKSGRGYMEYPTGNKKLIRTPNAYGSYDTRYEDEVAIDKHTTFYAETIFMYNSKTSDYIKESMIVINSESDGQGVLCDEDNEDLKLNKYATVSHELLGHAYDFYTRSKKDSSVEIENITRDILKLKRRSGTDHKETIPQ